MPKFSNRTSHEIRQWIKLMPKLIHYGQVGFEFTKTSATWLGNKVFRKTNESRPDLSNLKDLKRDD